MLAIVAVNAVALNFMKKARSKFPRIFRYVQESTITTSIGLLFYIYHSLNHDRCSRWILSASVESNSHPSHDQGWLSEFLYDHSTSSYHIRKVSFLNMAKSNLVSTINMHKVIVLVSRGLKRCRKASSGILEVF